MQVIGNIRLRTRTPIPLRNRGVSWGRTNVTEHFDIWFATAVDTTLEAPD